MPRIFADWYRRSVCELIPWCLFIERYLRKVKQIRSVVETICCEVDVAVLFSTWIVSGKVTAVFLVPVGKIFLFCCSYDMCLIDSCYKYSFSLAVIMQHVIRIRFVLYSMKLLSHSSLKLCLLFCYVDVDTDLCCFDGVHTSSAFAAVYELNHAQGVVIHGCR